MLLSLTASAANPPLKTCRSPDRTSGRHGRFSWRWSARGVTSHLAAFVFVLLVALCAPRAFPAQLPVKHYAATNLPPELEGTAARLDNAGKVFGTTRTLPTEFLIYDPAATGPNALSVRRIPSPTVPNLRRFGIVEINQKGQFVTLQPPLKGTVTISCGTVQGSWNSSHCRRRTNPCLLF